MRRARPHRGLILLAGVLLLAGAAAAQQGDLDPEEANVIDVDWLEQENDTMFWVTLYKDTEGYAGAADWWQLEQLDGTSIGRHTIASQPTPQFTTNETFTVPDGVRYIVVRGHDSQYGYGGRAIVVDLGGGGTQQYDQGSDGDDLSASDGSGGTGEDGTGGGGGGGIGGGNDTDGGLVPRDPEQFDREQENDTEQGPGDGVPSGIDDETGPRVPAWVIALLGVLAAAGAVLAWRLRDHS